MVEGEALRGDRRHTQTQQVQLGAVCERILMRMEAIAIPREPVEGFGLESPSRAAECSFPALM